MFQVCELTLYCVRADVDSAVKSEAPGRGFSEVWIGLVSRDIFELDSQSARNARNKPVVFTPRTARLCHTYFKANLLELLPKVQAKGKQDDADPPDVRLRASADSPWLFVRISTVYVTALSSTLCKLLSPDFEYRLLRRDSRPHKGGNTFNVFSTLPFHSAKTDIVAFLVRSSPTGFWDLQPFQASSELVLLSLGLALVKTACARLNLHHSVLRAISDLLVASGAPTWHSIRIAAQHSHHGNRTVVGQTKNPRRLYIIELSAFDVS